MKNNIINKNNLRVLLIGTILILLAGLFGYFFYFFELFSHFYLQYLCGVIILFITSLILKDKTSIIISLLLIIYLGYFVNKSTIIQKNISGNTDLYYLNANYFINNSNEVIENIKIHKPKYLAIVELSPTLYDKIKNELNLKNELYFKRGVNSFGFFTNEKIFYSKTHNLTYPVGEIKIKETDIYLIHPLPGLNKSLSEDQKKNFLEIKKLYKNNKNNKKIILGDFNSSFYSQVFKNYFGELYYKPIYSRNINGILRLPIDYAIGNKNFFTINRSDLNVSDHSPLLINFEN